jgi:hypothetical protein
MLRINDIRLLRKPTNDNASKCEVRRDHVSECDNSLSVALYYILTLGGSASNIKVSKTRVSHLPSTMRD